MSPQPDDNNTPTRPIRVTPDLWDRFGEATTGQKLDRSAALRDFMWWYIHGQGAKLPKRPAEPVPDPADRVSPAIRVVRDPRAATSPNGRTVYEMTVDAREDAVAKALLAAGIKTGYATTADGQRTIVRVLSAAGIATRIYEALGASGLTVEEKS